MLNNESSIIFISKSMEKAIEEIEKELEKANESRFRAMLAIFKLREEYSEQYLKRKRGKIRSKEELLRLAEACRLNWKLMEEVGIIRRISNEEIVVKT